jgi:hypothetical protein
VVDELFPESLHDAPEIAPTRDTVPAPQKVGAFTSLKDGFQHVLARCIAITSDLRKSRVDRLQSAAVEDATEELVPHGLIGQAFLDTPEEPKLAAEFESPAPERDAWEEDQTIIESLHVQDADDYRAIDPPLVDPPAIGHPAEKDLPDHILVAGIPVPMFLQAEELHNEEVQNEVQGTPVPELENIPVMLNLPPGHVLEDVGSPVSDSGPQNAPLQTRATDEEALGGASQLSIRATQSAPKNIRVITIRPVRRDKRLWNAAILAVSCAVLALAVISLPKHLSSKLSGTSANSSQAGSIAEPAQTPDNVATELTDPLQTSAHTSVTTHSKPARAFSLSTSRVQAASQKQALPKARTRSSGNDFVAKDTFVDYRNRRTTAPAPAQQTSVKRVVVEN